MFYFYACTGKGKHLPLNGMFSFREGLLRLVRISVSGVLDTGVILC